MRHPIDAEIRARLRLANVHQTDFAKRIGRSQSWLNNYMHGAGKATIDDVIRIVALLAGLEEPTLSEMERRLVKAFRVIPDEADRVAFVGTVENIARAYRRGRRAEPPGPRVRTPPRKANTGQ